MIETLEKALDTRGAHLLYAAESGSRAWGFESTDSDYDIRFIYSWPRERYLHLGNLETDISFTEGLLDHAGWDLRKTMWLAFKSNPSLIEWLKSPIVYADRSGLRAELLRLLETSHNPRALAHHYNNFMRNVKGRKLTEVCRGELTMKGYLYMARPALALQHVAARPGELPPIELSKLLDSLSVPDRVVEALERIVVQKRLGFEQARYTDQVLDDWLDERLACGDEVCANVEDRPVRLEPFNELLMEQLEVPIEHRCAACDGTGRGL